MNDEQSKRLADAADAVIAATEALDEARDALADKRFDGEQERDRVAAGQQLSSKLDNAGKRIEESIRKGTIAAAAIGRTGAYQRYRDAWAAVREGRALGRSAADQDGAANKRARGQEAADKLDTALTGAAFIVFGE
ncbi:MAG: hypothetical protein HYX53_01130 [Chloroflexi bacterium]|nr:hypothetical protein [Chloroflexota bacterium]